MELKTLEVKVDLPKSVVGKGSSKGGKRKQVASDTCSAQFCIPYLVPKRTMIDKQGVVLTRPSTLEEHERSAAKKSKQSLAKTTDMIAALIEKKIVEHDMAEFLAPSVPATARDEEKPSASSTSKIDKGLKSFAKHLLK